MATCTYSCCLLERRGFTQSIMIHQYSAVVSVIPEPTHNLLSECDRIPTRDAVLRQFKYDTERCAASARDGAQLKDGTATAEQDVVAAACAVQCSVACVSGAGSVACVSGAVLYSLC